MKKSLFIVLVCSLLLIVVGCGIKRMEPNIKFGWIKVYVPDEFTYRPDLRGLIYSEDERQIYIKGDPYDRSEAVIIELLKQTSNFTLSEYIENTNKNLTIKYNQINKEPQIYLREKYEGHSGNTTIYSYTYMTTYNSIIYQITISGPQEKEKELDNLRETVLYSLIIG